MKVLRRKNSRSKTGQRQVRTLNKRAMAAACAVTALAVLFSGCVRREEQKSLSVKELSDISPALGYLAARAEHCEGFIYVENSKSDAGSFAYLYDSAAAIIALTEAGADYHAQLIADALVFAMNHDRFFDDGRLRNAYAGGNPERDSGWSILRGREAVRLPGIWKDGVWSEDYYAVSTSTGNMAWAILALCDAARNATEKKAAEYTGAAQRAAEFVLTLRSDTGGFTGGYEGWDQNQVVVTYKSTEHNIDLICAFTSLASLIRETDPLKADIYTEASEHAKTFVLGMYDKRLHCFYTGTQNDGVTVNKGVLPLDTNTWAILALNGEFADARSVIGFVEQNISVGRGFDFSAGDLNGIWNEGTAQMAVCYRLLGDIESYDRVMAYLATQTAEDGSVTATDRNGVSTGFMVSGTDIMWKYDNTTNLGATNWTAFAQMGVNPLRKR